MDKTIRTIRKTITEAKNGIVPAIILVVDTNILADIGWGRDQNTIHLIEHAAKFRFFSVLYGQDGHPFC